MYRKIYRSMQLLCMLTLLLTSILLLSACYTVFESSIKNDLRSEGHILAQAINAGVSPETFAAENDKTRISVIDKSGEVVFDNSAKDISDNHLDRIEVKDALQNGTGEVQRFSKTSKSRVFYFAIKLDDGNILRISQETQSIFRLMLSLVWPVIAVLVLVYILSVTIAVRLTDNIIKPFSKINLTDGIKNCGYSELEPFFKRIAGQKKEIEHQIEKVKMQKSRLQAISENMSEGLVVLDKSENILSANKSALSVFGSSEEEVVHKGFIYLCRDITLNRAIKSAYKGNKCSIEFSSGGRHYQIFLSPVLENSDVAGVILLIFDISEKFETEQIRREFSANVSHELKTPITTILGYSQIINKGIAKPEDIKGFSEKIEKEASRLVKLIDDIIKLSRLDDEENADISMQKIHLKSVIDNTVEQLSDSIEKKNISIIYDGGDTVIEGNPVQISELVYNLCENAIKYNKDGGNVTISVGEKSFSVADTGIGISPEYHARVFERFFRVDKSRSKSVNGTGLGLSIVKHIAKCHDAEIKLESEPGIGTKISVIFKR